jgi:hypothetical protein
MLKKFWPSKIVTPHIPLGISLKDGLDILRSVNKNVKKVDDGKEVSFRVEGKEFSIAIFETNKRISSVLYNDSFGRLTKFGKNRKIRIYLSRYTLKGHWDGPLNSGGITFYFNDIDNCSMAYGNHMDVIRFNTKSTDT